MKFKALQSLSTGLYEFGSIFLSSAEVLLLQSLQPGSGGVLKIGSSGGVFWRNPDLALVSIDPRSRERVYDFDRLMIIQLSVDL